jgi:hypothetical protein
VRNIPSEKRNEEHAAFAGSLVGVTLDIDVSTIHRPEYVRILLGCRDVEKIPDKAEGCMGDNFYTFYYEIDKVVVGGPPKNAVMIPVNSNSDVPSPKRARTDNNSQTNVESSEGQSNEGYQMSGSGSLGKSYAVTLETLSEHESEEESEENNELLIEEMMREKNSEHKDSQVEDGLNQDNETFSDMMMDDQRLQNPSLEGIDREECDLPVDIGKALIIHTPVTSVWKIFQCLLLGLLV